MTAFSRIPSLKVDTSLRVRTAFLSDVMVVRWDGTRLELRPANEQERPSKLVGPHALY